ncbi:hypothetical protein WA026_012077 [Henosepilachna vigintioctopunctata]|uniref:Uncharacterized protein n=1 Tax=Henosepilachna vigintioctopunctata TaxID=420089 RepID=A0AAW1VF37_9CUCU
MKLQAFIFVSLTIYYEVSSQYALRDFEEIFDIPLVKTVSQMMRKNCRNKNTEFKENLKFMERCYLNIKGKESFCNLFQNNLEKCTGPFVDTLENCVETKYHDIPKFGVNVVNVTADYLCKSKVEKIVEILHPCLHKIVLEKSKVCLSELREVLVNIDKENNLTNIKTNICKSLENTKTCFLADFENNCKNKVTLVSAVGLYDAIVTKPCKHNTIESTISI